MPEKPLTAASLRGAVDLSALAKPAAARPGAAPRSTEASGTPNGLVQQVDDNTFGAAVEMSLDVPVILAVYSGARPASQQHVDELASIVGSTAVGWSSPPPTSTPRCRSAKRCKSNRYRWCSR
ncbi:putative thioredoxin [Branchiibius hedensis]|uniref:Putative thioredoxin n=1 Tax=Branchiibius hedensis TaxID=672460 RepID=A0A2Y9C0Y3_9MICO|nr:hypothetical protein [Branchiibius hedensis]PWJ24506.1 putative thioredoxin [Branchiibius hedensis]SSA33323.1 putative thioredoxin [Branchiibius hedensis]